MTVAPQVSASDADVAATLAASQSVAKPLASTATRVAAQAPQAKAKARLRHGSGSM